MTRPALQLVEQSGGAGGATGTGEQLAQARRRSGQSLEQVAAMTRIRRRHLEAIERGDLGALPGPVYARGYVRAYAEHLGLDGQGMAAAMSAEATAAGGTAARRRLSLAELAPASAGGRLALTAPLAAGLGLALAAVLFGAYAWRQIDSARGLNDARPAPAAVAPPIAGPQPLGSPAPAPAAPAAESPPSRLLVALRASEDSWVTVTVDDRTAYSGLLKPGADLTFLGRRIRVAAWKPSLLVSVAGGDYQAIGAPAREYSADT